MSKPRLARPASMLSCDVLPLDRQAFADRQLAVLAAQSNFVVVQAGGRRKNDRVATGGRGDWVASVVLLLWGSCPLS